MTISTHNYMSIEQTYRELKDEIPLLQRSDIHFNIAHQSSHYYGNDEKHLTLSSDMIKSIDEYNQKKRLRGQKLHLLIEYINTSFKDTLQQKKLQCPAGLSQVQYSLIHMGIYSPVPQKLIQKYAKRAYTKFYFRL